MNKSKNESKKGSADQNRAIAKDAALTGLPTLNEADEPTKAQRLQWGREYAASRDGALRIVDALNQKASAAPQAAMARLHEHIETAKRKSKYGTSNPIWRDVETVCETAAELERVKAQYTELLADRDAWIRKYDESEIRYETAKAQCDEYHIKLGAYILALKVTEQGRDDLLEAAKDAVFDSVDASTYPDGPCLQKHVRDALRAAIAKAEKGAQS